MWDSSPCDGVRIFRGGVRIHGGGVSTAQGAAKEPRWPLSATASLVPAGVHHRGLEASGRGPGRFSARGAGEAAGRPSPSEHRPCLFWKVSPSPFGHGRPGTPGAAELGGRSSCEDPGCPQDERREPR